MPGVLQQVNVTAGPCQAASIRRDVAVQPDGGTLTRSERGVARPINSDAQLLTGYDLFANNNDGVPVFWFGHPLDGRFLVKLEMAPSASNAENPASSSNEEAERLPRGGERGGWSGRPGWPTGLEEAQSVDAALSPTPSPLNGSARLGNVAEQVVRAEHPSIYQLEAKIRRELLNEARRPESA